MCPSHYLFDWTGHTYVHDDDDEDGYDDDDDDDGYDDWVW